MLRLAVSFWLLASVLSSRHAKADAREASHSAFQEGVKQMQNGGCKSSPVKDAALCKLAAKNFAQAFALNPAGLGALKNLARVTQSLGQLQTAAVSLAKLQALASADPDPARRIWAEFAETEREALARRVPKLVVEVVGRSEEGPYTVRVNGNVLAAKNLGTPVQYDPGSYELTLSQGDREVLRQTAVLRESETLRVVLALKKHPESAASGPENAPRSFPVAAPSRVLPLTLTIAGGASVLGGLGFGYMALTKRDAGCDAGARTCTGGKLKDAKSAATISTFLTVGGGVLLGGGLTWYFLKPNTHEAAAADQLAFGVAPRDGGGELQLTGTF